MFSSNAFLISTDLRSVLKVGIKRGARSICLECDEFLLL